MSDAAVTLTETETSVLVAHLFSQWLRSETPWTEWAPRLSNDALAAFSDQAETRPLRHREASEAAIESAEPPAQVGRRRDDPPPEKDDGGLDWGQVESITITEIVDYH